MTATNLRSCLPSPVASVRYWTRNAIDVDRLLAGVSGAGLGGTAMFVGSVRSGPEDGPVKRIEYTAYEAMLEKEFDRILGEAAQQWPTVRANAIHRLGAVPVEEASIAVIAAAPHRAEAFAACRYIIEEVKKRLPVWKKEILADGQESWRSNKADRLVARHAAADQAPPV